MGKYHMTVTKHDISHILVTSHKVTVTVTICDEIDT